MYGRRTADAFLRRHGLNVAVEAVGEEAALGGPAQVHDAEHLRCGGLAIQGQMHMHTSAALSVGRRVDARVARAVMWASENTWPTSLLAAFGSQQRASSICCSPHGGYPSPTCPSPFLPHPAAHLVRVAGEDQAGVVGGEQVPHLLVVGPVAGNVLVQSGCGLSAAGTGGEGRRGQVAQGWGGGVEVRARVGKVVTTGEGQRDVQRPCQRRHR